MKIRLTVLYFLTLIVHPISWGDFSQVRAYGGPYHDIELYQKPGDDSKLYAYVAQGANLFIYDISDLENPVNLWRIQNGLETVYGLAIDNGILAAACGINGTLLFSLENPEKPELIQTEPDYVSRGVDLFGSILIVTQTKVAVQGGPSKQYDLQIFFDISETANLKKIESYGYSTDFYGHTYQTFYRTIDPDDPVLLWGICHGSNYQLQYEFLRDMDLEKYSIETSFCAFLKTKGIIPNYDTACVTLNDRISIFRFYEENKYEGLKSLLYDEIDSIHYEGIAGGVIYDGSFAYLPILDGAQAAVIDISKRDSLSEISRIDIPFVPHNIQYGIGCVVDPEIGISLMEISAEGIGKQGRIAHVNIEAPTGSSAKNIHQNIQYYIDKTELRIRDLSDPSQPKELGVCYVLPPDDNRKDLIRAENDYLFISRYNSIESNRIFVFDISQPAEPLYITDFSLQFPDAMFSHINHIWTDNKRLIILGENDLPEFRSYLPFCPFSCYDISDISNPILIESTKTNMYLQFYSEKQDCLWYFSPSSGYLALSKTKMSSSSECWREMK